MAGMRVSEDPFSVALNTDDNERTVLKVSESCGISNSLRMDLSHKLFVARTDLSNVAGKLCRVN